MEGGREGKVSKGDGGPPAPVPHRIQGHCQQEFCLGGGKANAQLSLFLEHSGQSQASINRHAAFKYYHKRTAGPFLQGMVKFPMLEKDESLCLSMDGPW